jgi:hypothetical protein
MNSDAEKAVFERWGWTYDSVRRAWVAPDGYLVETDTLVTVSDLLGLRMMVHVRRVAREHGCVT